MAQLLLDPQVVRAAQLERQASRPLAAQSWDAQQERAPAERKPGLAGRAEPRPAWLPEPQLLASGEPLAAQDAAVAQRQLPSSA